MSTKYTPDGYSYNGDDWAYIRNVTWQHLGDANDFMVFIGERGASGVIKPFISRLMDVGALSFALKLIPVVGQFSSFLMDNPLVTTALQRGLSEFGVSVDPKKIPELINEAVTALDQDTVLENLKVPVYVSDAEFQPIKDRWDGLDQLHQFYVVKQFYMRLAYDHGNIIRHNYEDQGLLRSIMVMSRLIPDFTSGLHPDIFRLSPKGRKFWLGDGFGIHMNHILSRKFNGGQLDSQFHINQWNESAKAIAMLDFSATEQEADNFLNAPTPTMENTVNSSGGGGAVVIGIAVGLLQLLGG